MAESNADAPTRDDELTASEKRMRDAVRSAMRDYLDAVRRAVLGDTVQSDAHPSDLPPNMDSWPPGTTWSDKVDSWVIPAAGKVWRDGYWDTLKGHSRDNAELDDADYVDEYLRDTKERMTGAGWPDEVYEAVREQVITSRDQHETQQQLRERIADTLEVDNWSARSDAVARSEHLAGLNAGHYKGAQRREQVFGEKLWKQWSAVEDSRTRPDHAHADGQIVAMDDEFDIGGEGLRYPHDNRGSAESVVNCRCTLLYKDASEVPDDIRGAAMTSTTQADADAAPGSWCERVAAAVPTEPPAAWFTNPELTGPTKIRVTDEGRVFGHVAGWGVDHAAEPGVTADLFRGEGYHRFHRHPIRTADGTRMKTGPLSTGGHADDVTVTAAQAHYDDPTFVAADVTAGEDAHGIWVSGALRPGVSPFQVQILDRYSISGDWRDGELVAACAVSAPGFHLDHDDSVVALSASASGEHRSRLGESRPRARRDDDGYLRSLTAAGVVTEREPATQPPFDGWRLYREFKAAHAADTRVTQARRRLSLPRVLAAAARVRRKEN